MKLRSHRSASPSKRKNPKYEESSDEESDDSESDSSFSKDESDSSDSEKDVGESSVRATKNGVSSRRVPDLNKIPVDLVVSDSEDSSSDSEMEVKTPKRRKVGVRRNIPVARKRYEKRRKNGGPPLMWEIWEKEQERWIFQNLNSDVDLESQNEVIAETVDTPSDLVMPLLRYQKEWLAWALKQEESATRGGILADEMGMGKTVQAIALVLAKRELMRGIYGPEGLSPLPSSSTGLPGIKATLVICPLVAVIQWVSEIERFTSKGSNKILVYHGNKRGKSIQQFSEYDFIITTYSIAESEYRKNVMPPKQKCQWCGKLFYDRKLVIHLKYFCGPDAKKTAKQSKQQRGNKNQLKMSDQKSVSTEGLEGEVDDGKKGAQKKTAKRNYKRKNVGNSCMDNTAANVQDTLGEKSILHSVKWDRIILDEAHYIKDRRCNTTRAILALESSYKWALSGTPLQNRVGELYSLVRFLQIVPYSYYFCKDCDCRVLDYGSTQCSNCPHKSVRHFCWWNKYVATPIQAQGNVGEGRNAMILLKQKVLKGIVLRRTKKGRAADLALPPRIVTLRRDTLDIREEDYYTSLYNESQSQFNTYIEAGTLLNNYAHIFDLLTRLRQAVDHPYLVVYSKTASARRASVADVGTEEQICELCHEPVEDPVVSSCEHIFCKSCLIDFSASMGQVTCPTCSKPLTVDFSTNAGTGDQNPKTTVVKGFRSSSILNRINLDEFQTSTKIDALREEIRFMVERDGSAKAIVFSQFTSFLDLIHYSLQKSGISCVQLVGSMSMKARDDAISRFTNDPDCKIFLMSLKAGGVALNLTVASHVFLMDPWWNPAVERQAQDRIHRIGQYKPIRIVRFVIQNTIEERILKLQEKKELVFEGTVGGSSEALGKLTEADLKFLFVT